MISGIQTRFFLLALTLTSFSAAATDRLPRHLPTWHEGQGIFVWRDGAVSLVHRFDAEGIPARPDGKAWLFPGVLCDESGCVDLPRSARDAIWSLERTRP